jgi:phosphoribosyl 1,2-cyclic phosphodiesterase
VKVKIWGARGSIPAPGPRTARYGGNTSCVLVTLSNGSVLVLDAGSGIRDLGLVLAEEVRRIDILLTHLHLDHIQGLLFFAPLFRREAEVVVWGPPAARRSLRDRVGRYLSAPLSPIEIRGLPARVSFRSCPRGEWELGSARVRAAEVKHRGPTLGFRISEGDTSLCYLPDHEPALGLPLEGIETDWISGHDLARGGSLLMHDCQYTDQEYPSHVGWGHSRVSDALLFARRSEVRRLLLFHHDPLHSDEELDQLHAAALERWGALGGEEGQIGMAVEGSELELGPAGAPVSAPSDAGARVR